MGARRIASGNRARAQGPAHTSLAGVSSRDRGDSRGAIVEHARRSASSLMFPRPVNLALALRAKGDLDGRARRISRGGPACRMTPLPAIGFGFVLNAQGDRDAAMAEFREAIRLNPNHLISAPEPWRCTAGQGGLGRRYCRATHGRPAQARGSLGPRAAGQSAKATGDRDGADAVPREAKVHDESARHVALGRKLEERKDLPGAIAEHRKALAIKPGNAEAQRSLATFPSENGEVDAAIAAFHTAIQLDPDRGSIHNNLGLGAGEQGGPRGSHRWRPGRRRSDRLRLRRAAHQPARAAHLERRRRSALAAARALRIQPYNPAALYRRVSLR